MKNFRSIRSILSNIPKALFQETNESDFMDYMLDAIKLLPQTIYYEPKIEVFEIIDGKVQLPKYVKQINSVMWQCSDPSKECIDSLMNSCTDLEPEPADVNPAVCKPMITYKMFLDSPYFKENYKIIKYVGTDKSLISNNCPCKFASCAETFVVTPEKTMYLSIDTGFICVNYDTPVCDEKGDILIPDDQILVEYLVAYCIAKHWENRQFSKEEQAANFYNQYNQKQALLHKQARGRLMLSGMDFANIMDINGQFTKLIKLPEILFYAR